MKIGNVNGMQPAVSILMPFYNQEAFLQRAIVSVLNQSYKNFELILIDDASDDSSLEIAESYTDDERVKVIHCDIKSGPPAALLKGFGLASGKYIARHDSDDWSSPNRLQKQIEFLDRNPQITICGTLAHDVFPDGSQKPLTRAITDDEIKIDSLFHIPMLSTSIMGRRELFQKHGFECETPKVCGDYILFATYFREYAFANLPEPLMWKQVHTNSATAVSTRQNVVDADLMAKRLILETLGFTPTEDEMRIHNLLSERSEVEKMRENTRLSSRDALDVMLWAEKIIRNNRQAGVFNADLLAARFNQLLAGMEMPQQEQHTQTDMGLTKLLPLHQTTTYEDTNSLT